MATATSAVIPENTAPRPTRMVRSRAANSVPVAASVWHAKNAAFAGQKSLRRHFTARAMSAEMRDLRYLIEMALLRAAVIRAGTSPARRPGGGVGGRVAMASARTSEIADNPASARGPSRSRRAERKIGDDSGFSNGPQLQVAVQATSLSVPSHERQRMINFDRRPGAISPAGRARPPGDGCVTAISKTVRAGADRAGFGRRHIRCIGRHRQPVDDHRNPQKAPSSPGNFRQYPAHTTCHRKGPFQVPDGRASPIARWPRLGQTAPC